MLIIREAILMVLMTLMTNPTSGEALVGIMKDLFRNWGDQVAAQEGNGMLVSMWYAFLKMTLTVASRLA
jgi:hypothetical protein